MFNLKAYGVNITIHNVIYDDHLSMSWGFLDHLES